MVNILVTGTPGTGKSTVARAVVDELDGYQFICVGDLVKEKALHEGRDDEWDSLIVNEDLLLDELEPLMAKGNVILEHHGSDFFPERFFDLVVVLRCENQVLYPRLVKREYSEKKIEENISAEIFQVCLDEAMESYKPDIVWELANNTMEDMESNVEKIVQFVKESGPSM